jgi:hypothetical protein
MSEFAKDIPQQSNVDIDIQLHKTQSEPQPITKQNYGEKFQDHLLEQYKLYVEMADRNSSRRNQINNFYISLLSSLLAFIALVTNKDIVQFRGSDSQAVAFLAVAILGVLLCSIWYVNIQSYKQLSSSKFKVIHELEKQMPFPCYDKEWNFLKKDKQYKGYLTQTNVERSLPAILSIPYLGLLFYSLMQLF